MEGLRAGFDSNDDGILSAEDDHFDQFKIWQDANGDGQVDEGELVSLQEAGIESIGLISDGESRTAADGDVIVHGEAEVTFTDGSTGVAADAEFAFEEFFEQDLVVSASDGSEVNLDDVAGIDAAPAENGSNLNDLPEGGEVSGEDDAAAAAEVPV